MSTIGGYKIHFIFSESTAFPDPVSDVIPVTGVRRCWGCHCLYAAAAAPNPVICPACGSEHTAVHPVDSPHPAFTEVAPTQEALFAVPPPPRPNAWSVEWRFKKEVRAALQATGIPLSAFNDWNRWSERNITTERQAVNQVRRLRKAFPAKSWRVKAVSWDPVPLLP